MVRNNAIADVFPARTDGTVAFGTKGRILSGKKGIWLKQKDKGTISMR